MIKLNCFINIINELQLQLICGSPLLSPSPALLLRTEDPSPSTPAASSLLLVDCYMIVIVRRRRGETQGQ